MKGSSKVIVGATLIMVVCLALVLGLVLVLLAELYCSLLFRRRKLRRPTTTSSNMPTTVTSLPVPATSNVYDRQHQEEQHSMPPPSVSSFYAHGVLHAPRSFLFPSVHVVNGNYHLQDLEKQQQHYSLGSLLGDESQTHHLQLPSTSSSSSSPHEFIGAGHAFSLPSPPTTFTPVASPPVIVQYYSGDDEVRGENENNNYIYICNPIYDNNDGNNNPVVRVDDTPFETPDSSPSRLETMGSSGEEDDHDHDDVSTTHPSSSSTPPLTPMKNLPAVGCSSVSLKRNARSSLATSVSDSNNSINIYGKSSSSSSGSPCTSPSW